MILTENQIQSLQTELNISNERVKGLSMTLEYLVRAYTHNNFQVRHIRSAGRINGNEVETTLPLKVGDTVDIDYTFFNNSFYNVEKTELGKVIINDTLENGKCLVTKCKYPLDVQNGVMNLIRWEINNRNKVGIKSETISRHSVTYFDQDKNNQVMGYPVSLMGFLKPYMKGRF